MMEIKKGMVVRSSAGHDGGRFYVVLAVEGQFAYIADGKLRQKERPKKKNVRHLAPTATMLDIEALDTDQKIRRALWPFNYGDQGTVAI